MPYGCNKEGADESVSMVSNRSRSSCNRHGRSHCVCPGRRPGGCRHGAEHRRCPRQSASSGRAACPGDASCRQCSRPMPPVLRRRRVARFRRLPVAASAERGRRICGADQRSHCRQSGPDPNRTYRRGRSGVPVRIPRRIRTDPERVQFGFVDVHLLSK